MVASFSSASSCHIIIYPDLLVHEARLLKLVSSLHWKASAAKVKPNDILVNLNLMNGMLIIVRNKLASSSLM